MRGIMGTSRRVRSRVTVKFGLKIRLDILADQRNASEKLHRQVCGFFLYLLVIPVRVHFTVPQSQADLSGQIVQYIFDKSTCTVCQRIVPVQLCFEKSGKYDLLYLIQYILHYRAVRPAEHIGLVDITTLLVIQKDLFSDQPYPSV